MSNRPYKSSLEYMARRLKEHKDRFGPAKKARVGYDLFYDLSNEIKAIARGEDFQDLDPETAMQRMNKLRLIDLQQTYNYGYEVEFSS